MSGLPRRFEFECWTNSGTHAYEVDLDFRTSSGHVGLWLSPRHESYEINGRKLFDVFTEELVARHVQDGDWIIVQDFTPTTNIEDLI